MSGIDGGPVGRGRVRWQRGRCRDVGQCSGGDVDDGE
jgi:hypothetical protein